MSNITTFRKTPIIVATSDDKAIIIPVYSSEYLKECLKSMLTFWKNGRKVNDYIIVNATKIQNSSLKLNMIYFAECLATYS